MAVGDAYVFPGFLTPVPTQLFFPKPPTTFSHASTEMRGENTPERKVTSTGDRTHNHQVMSPTRSPLSHPGGDKVMKEEARSKTKKKIATETEESLIERGRQKACESFQKLVEKN